MLNYEIWGNSVQTWIVSLLIIAGAFIVVKLLSLLGRKVIKPFIGRTNNRVDDIIYYSLESPLKFAVMLLGIWIAIHRLVYPDKIRRQCLQHTDHTRHHLGSGPPLHSPAPAILGAAVRRPCAENDAGCQADDPGSDLDHRSGNCPEQCRGRHQCVVGHAGHRRYRLRPGGAGYREEYLRRVHHIHGQALRHRRHDQRERLRRDGGRRGHAQYANHGLRPAHHQLSELQNYGRLDRQHLVGTDAPRHG